MTATTPAPKVAAIEKLGKRKRGRPEGSVDSDLDFDRRVYEAWNNGEGQHRNFDDVAKAFGRDRDEVWYAKERHRKRLAKSEENAS